MQPPGFSILTLSLLLLIVLASTAVFSVLVRRWTTQRLWVGLHDWARGRRLKVKRHELSPPEGLAALGVANLRATLEIGNESVALLQLESPKPRAEPDRWHVLVRRTPAKRDRAALRPMERGACVVDLAGLSDYPSLAVGRRFAALGANWSAARAVSDSSLRTLMPPDIAVGVAENWLILDFSTRRFDPIELDRMLALSKQLSQLLG